jgi:putative tricarboxylic transport membrane protein
VKHTISHRPRHTARRTLRRAIAILAAGLTASAPLASAQGFKPSKPIEIVVHSGPGGGNDVLARTISNIADKEKLLPMRLQVLNKPGGNSAVAMAYLAEKKGDTHTIALHTSLWFINPIMRAEAKVTMKELTPIARLVLEPAMIVVKADSPYKTLKDFIDAAKATPGQLKQSGGSIGSRDWIVRAQFAKYTGANWAFISFPGGGERIAALLGGHVQLMVIEPQEAGDNIRAGKMRVLAQLTDKRLPQFPDTPTIKEAGFDFQLSPVYRGAVGPPEMPAEALAFWQDFFQRLSRSPLWRKNIEDNMFEDGLLMGTELNKYLETFPDQIRGILRDAGVKMAR